MSSSVRIRSFSGSGESSPSEPSSSEPSWNLGEVSLAVIALFLGGGLLSVANDSSFAIVGVVLCLALVFILNSIIQGDQLENRALLLTYSSCIVAAGVAQWYSVYEFKSVVSTIDAAKFYDLIYNKKLTTIEELSHYVNSPLAVLVWKKFYQVFSVIGIDGGAWLAVCVNSAIVAFSAALAVKCAKIIFPTNPSSWKVVGTLASLSGFNIVFGALILRDSFALLFNIIIFYWILRAYTYKGVKDIILAAVFILLSSLAMLEIRESSAILSSFVVFLAVGTWVIATKISPIKILILLTMTMIALVLYQYILSGIDVALSAYSKGNDQYSGGAAYAAREASLGITLIVNQPFFIKIFVAPVYVYLFPIPAWGFFQWGLTPYYPMRGLQAIFALIFAPHLVLGIRQILKKISKINQRSVSELFLVLYFVAMLLSVATTTLESRHFGQFSFALILLIASVSNNKKNLKSDLNFYRKVCYSFILLIYIAWGILRLI